MLMGLIFLLIVGARTWSLDARFSSQNGPQLSSQRSGADRTRCVAPHA